MLFNLFTPSVPQEYVNSANVKTMGRAIFLLINFDLPCNGSDRAQNKVRTRNPILAFFKNVAFYIGGMANFEEIIRRPSCAIAVSSVFNIAENQ